MKTITLVACNRPEYTAKALAGIARALTNSEPYDKLLISVDPDPKTGKIDPGMSEMFEAILPALAGTDLIETDMFENVVTMGPGGNHQVALQRAFELTKSDYSVVVEDDAFLSNDALVLADWFNEEYGSITSEYLILSMSNHRDFGKGQNTEIPEDPSFLVEAAHLTSPFAWACTKYQWPFLKATWNRKFLPPNGYDWSMSYYMNRTSKKGLHPVVSRCQNIGREGGYNETPESFDKSQLGLTYSRDHFTKDFSIVAKLQEPWNEPHDWMRSEIERMFPGC